MQRGSTPRVYRNVLVFLAAETRQLENLKEAMRSVLAWDGIVREDGTSQPHPERQRARQGEIDRSERDGENASNGGLVPTCCIRDRTGRRLMSRGYRARCRPATAFSDGRARDWSTRKAFCLNSVPARLDRELQRYIWQGKNHLSLKDLREYLNRYIHLPRLKDRSVLVRTVATAVGGMLPGPFALCRKLGRDRRNLPGASR